MIKMTDNITDQQARKLAMFMRFNAKKNARRAGYVVFQFRGNWICRDKLGRFKSLLDFMPSN